MADLAEQCPEGFFHLSYRYQLNLQFGRVQSLQIIFGQYKPFETEFFRFADALLNPVYGADLAGQAYFSRHADFGFYGGIHVAGQNGADNCQVDGGVVHFQSAGNVEKDVLLGKLEADPLFQYCQQHVHSPYVEAGGGTLRVAVNSTAHQCLRFYQERSYAFYGRSDGYAAHSFMVLAEEQFRRIAYLPQSVLSHLIDAQLGSAAETVFDAAQDAVHIMLVAFKLEHGVHNVLQYLRPGNASFLVDMADEDDRRMRFFGEAQDRGGAFPHLGYAAGRGFERLCGDGLYGVYYD